MVRKVSKNLLRASRNLRRKQTPWEQKLWQRIRAKRFFGLKFKRQVCVGDYIVDFCCDEKKLIIELDGSQHNQSGNREQDKERQEYLEKEGYKVLRFWNNDVDYNFDGVLEKIKKEVKNN